MRLLKPGLLSFVVVAGAILGQAKGGSSPAFSRSNTTATTLTSSANPSQAGQAVTLTAKVTARSGTPGGTVKFLDGSTALGTASLSGGAASLTTSTFSVGTHSLKANYLGQHNYSASSSAVLSQVVQGASTSTALTSSANPSVAGQAMTLMAKVSTSSGGTASGTAQFFDGSASLGTVTLSGGAASFTTSSLSVGTHSLKATYGGAGAYGGSTSPILSQTVNKAATTASVTSSANPALAGQPVTLAATVTAANGTPTGSVQFLDGSSVLATATLASGGASLTINSLGAGTHSISISYSGDSSHLASASPVLLETINPNPATTTTLTSSLNPSTVNQAVTFTAVVTSASGTPTGSVQFLDGSAALATATLASGSASVTVSSLAAGAHSITAAYSGNSTYSASSSPAVSQEVDVHSVSLTWTASTSANVVGYYVLRGGASGGPYVQLNSTAAAGVTYTDTTVQGGQTYYYVCTAVDNNNDQSGYSNETQAIVP